MSDYPYDDELSSGGTAPSPNDLVSLMVSRLSEWLYYVTQDPPLDELKARADKIMDDICAASGVRGAQEVAAELALAVDSRFEALGLWRAWYPRLMGLYSPVMDEATKQAQMNLFRCFMNFYLNRGDMVRANIAINMLIDLAALQEDSSLKEAMLGAAAVAAALDKGDKGLVLAEQLLELAETTGDHILMAEAYGVVAQFHATRLDVPKTYMYGQMVMCAGLPVKPDRFIPRGLHYMALAFQVAQNAQKALSYLDRAEAYAVVRGNVAQLEYMLLTRGACVYIAGDYAAAETHLRRAVEVFSGTGHYYAGALYAHGLALMKLKRYEDSIEQMEAALAEWKKMKREFDQIFARHGLAEAYSQIGQHREAIAHMAEALAVADSMPERCSPAFLKLLRDDFAVYVQRSQSPKA